MADIQRIGFNVTESMGNALKEEAGKRGATLSNLLRILIAERLEQLGYEVETGIAWGGDRKSKKAADEE